MKIVDHEKVSAAIREAAAKFILPRYRALAAHEISSKSSPRDLVTQADIEAEDFLTRVLPGFLPSSIVVGEESASKNPAILERLARQDLDIWVVDPVDGTHNFVHGKREFGVMLALIRGGETVQSWIYDVLGDEMTVASKGEGAYSGGARLNVKAAPVARMSGHINPGFFPKEYRAHIREAVGKFGETQSLSCAAHEYLRVAKGAAQFCIYSRLKPWDHLAGTLAVAEAGGYSAKWDGAPYVPKDHDVGLIASASHENWKDVYDVLIGPVAREKGGPGGE